MYSLSMRDDETDGCRCATSEGLGPAPVLKGRGAVSNRPGRFDRQERSGFDDGWFDDDGEAPALATTVTVERARSIISYNRSPDVPFDRSINPYRGCEHGCIYCYARPNHAYVGLSPGQDFESRLFVKSEAATLLRQELARPGYRCEPINIGSVTDAWQPLERNWKVTRGILEVLAQCRHPLTAITKSTLIERDIDLLAPMAKQGLAHVFVSLTTLDANLARIWEPRAAAPWRRVKMIARLSEAGIPVTVLVAPLTPFINEPELEKILEVARQAGAQRARAMVLRLPHELRELFGEWLQTHLPQRSKRVLARLAEMRGGRLNDPRFHARMKGEGDWADLIQQRTRIALRRLGYRSDTLTLRTDLFAAPKAGAQLELF
jgi:DNA repair photolyase